MGTYRAFRFSDDEGATWTAENTYLDDVAISGNDGEASCYLHIAPNGDVLFLSGSGIDGAYVDLVRRSGDGGKTWTVAASGIPDPHLRMVAGYGCVHDGVIYVPLHKFASQPNNASPWDQEVWASDDNGATWELQGMVPYAPATTGDEFSVMVTAGTNMIAVCRDRDGEATYWNKSSDLGATWGAREALPHIGIIQMPRMRRYAGGTLLFGREGAMGVTAIRPVIWYLPDGGTEWCRKYYPTTSATNDGHYCDVLQRADGNFYFMTYAGTTAIATIQDAVFGISS